MSEYTEIAIPNLYETPYIVSKIVLNNILYSFEYKWNTRADKPFLSIYTENEESKTYIIRDSILNTSSGNILSFVFSENLSGKLFFENKNNVFDIAEPTIKNISTDYQLLYVSE